MFWGNSGLKVHTIRAHGASDFGYALGRRVKKQILAVMDFVKKNSETEITQRYHLVSENLDFLSNNHSTLYEELRGLADGAGISLTLIAMLNFFEDFILKETEHCSLIVSAKDGEVLVGWNEDGNGLYSGKMSLISGHLDGKSFLGLNYPGLLCGDTLTINSSGLILAVQSLKPVWDGEVREVGLPRGLAGRIFMQAETLEEVLRLAQNLSQDKMLLHGFHLFCCDSILKEAVSIEFHPGLASPQYKRLRHHFFFAHTNHYQLLGGNYDCRQYVSASSRERLAYLEIFKKAPLFPQWLAEILSGHHSPHIFSQGEKICRDGQTVTLHGQVLTVPDDAPPTLWTSPGRPDQHEFSEWKNQKTPSLFLSP